MDAKNILKHTEQAKDDILKEVNDRLPRKVGVVAVNHFIMEYISGVQFAERYGISERTIIGAFHTGKTCNIPADAELPKKGKMKLTPLLRRLREEKPPNHKQQKTNNLFSFKKK